MTTRLHTLGACIFALAVLGAARGATADQIIDLRSGNGTVGGADSQITFVAGPANSAWVGALTPADFAAADAGAAARIVTPNGAWLSPAGFPNPAARWISNSSVGGVTEGSTALFAIDFTITDTLLTAASLSVSYSVDNRIGDPVNAGIFVNGAGLSGTGFTGNFNTVTSGIFDILSLLTTGTNTLYFLETDVGGPAGLMFTATITTEGSVAAVPAPGAGFLFGLGAAVLALGRRR